jgi:hypothetical protein
MAQRPRTPDDVLNSALLETVLKRLVEIETVAKQADNIDDLDDLTDDAEQQGEFSAYLCPVTDNPLGTVTCLARTTPSICPLVTCPAPMRIVRGAHAVSLKDPVRKGPAGV